MNRSHTSWSRPCVRGNNDFSNRSQYKKGNSLAVRVEVSFGNGSLPCRCGSALCGARIRFPSHHGHASIHFEPSSQDKMQLCSQSTNIVEINQSSRPQPGTTDCSGDRVMYWFWRLGMLPVILPFALRRNECTVAESCERKRVDACACTCTRRNVLHAVVPL